MAPAGGIRAPLGTYSSVQFFCTNLHHTITIRQCMFDKKIRAEESVLQELCLILTIRCLYYDNDSVSNLGFFSSITDSFCLILFVFTPHHYHQTMHV